MLDSCEQETVAAGDERTIAGVIEAMRPMFQADGGDCRLVSVDGDMVTVAMAGACSACQFAGATIFTVQEKLCEALGRRIRVVRVPTAR
jgi:NifU-like protein